jgi:hypothetical protein
VEIFGESKNQAAQNPTVKAEKGKLESLQRASRSDLNEQISGKNSLVDLHMQRGYDWRKIQTNNLAGV